MSHQETARETAFDAIASKASAWKKGYFEDTKLHLVAKPHPVIKDPMINRGTWFRVTLFQRVLQAFIDATEAANIVVLGAGLDTLYFRVRNLKPDHRFIELDLPEVCQLKAQKLRMQPVEGCKLTYCISGDPHYRLQSADLETDFFQSLGLDAAAPTLFLSDVVLSYIESDCTVELVQNSKKYFKDLTMLFFEMVNPHDPFGDMMVFNMSQREVYMPTFAEIGYLENYRRQLRRIGCKTLVSTAWRVYNCWEGRDKIEKLELLDEYEQFQLIMEHYAVVYGFTGERGQRVFAEVFEPCGLQLDAADRE